MKRLLCRLLGHNFTPAEVVVFQIHMTGWVCTRCNHGVVDEFQIPITHHEVRARGSFLYVPAEVRIH